MKIQQIKPKNTTLKDFKSLKKQTSKSSSKNIEKSWGRFGLSNIRYYPEAKFESVFFVDKTPPMPETWVDKFLNKLDDFAEPIVISKKEMKDYTKQVAKRVAVWKKVFG